jgi:hypothetical protein
MRWLHFLSILVLSITRPIEAVAVNANRLTKRGEMTAADYPS